MNNFLDRYFGLSKHGTSVRIEILGGVTTFAALAYIIVVNPAILQSGAKIPAGPSTVATILTVFLGTFLMGVYANRPIAVAPYMGENAFIAFTLTGLGLVWQESLGVVFVGGVLFLLLTVLGVRKWFADAISPSLKFSIVVGIGLFLLFIGMYEIGLVQNSYTGLPIKAVAAKEGIVVKSGVPLKIGDVSSPRTLLAIGGFLLITVLMYWRVRGALLIGIVVTAVIGIALGEGSAPKAIAAWPWSDEYNVGQIAFHLDIATVLNLKFLPIVLTLFLVSFLDTLGTLVAVGSMGNLLDEKGNMPEMHKPMLVDSVACMFAGLIGTTTSGAYIESVTGIREGARTGLSAVIVALLFLATLFFIPLVQPVQELGYAYGPALMIVGLIMFAGVRQVDFEDITETVPAVATIAMMAFTLNIANGLTAGLALYPFCKLCAGRWKEIHPAAAVLGFVCLAYYVFGVVH